MSGNPYEVIASPSYQAPDVSKFFQQQGGPQQGQGPQGQGLLDALKAFLNGPLAPGSAVPGSSGPTSVGGSGGPTPLMASGAGPQINSQGMGLY